MRVGECCLCRVGDDQKGGLFEEHNLVRPARLRKAEPDRGNRQSEARTADVANRR